MTLSVDAVAPRVSNLNNKSFIVLDSAGRQKKKCETPCDLNRHPKKERLEKEVQKKNPAPRSQKRKLDFSSKKKKQVEKEQWVCMVCGECYRNRRPGEEWVRCSGCHEWAHPERTDGLQTYECHNCTEE